MSCTLLVYCGNHRVRLACEGPDADRLSGRLSECFALAIQSTCVQAEEEFAQETAASWEEVSLESLARGSDVLDAPGVGSGELEHSSVSGEGTDDTVVAPAPGVGSSAAGRGPGVARGSSGRGATRGAGHSSDGGEAPAVEDETAAPEQPRYLRAFVAGQHARTKYLGNASVVPPTPERTDGLRSCYYAVVRSKVRGEPPQVFRRWRNAAAGPGAVDAVGLSGCRSPTTGRLHPDAIFHGFADQAEVQWYFAGLRLPLPAFHP